MVNFAPESIRGLVSPFITPTDRNGVVSEEGVDRLVLHQAGYIDGALIGGETGEFRHQTPDQRASMLEHVIRSVAELPPEKRFAVLFNATCDTVNDTINLVKYANEKEVDGIVIA
ncbi:MAG: dihydrodipicolinate synthase family protein, partial [Nanoarchaeota archaeon]|nr:dihydrodipicolinate synthase family protein [Nanoarchaeota archaeon]